MPHRVPCRQSRTRNPEIKEPRFHDRISLLTVAGRDMVYSFDCTVNRLSHCSGQKHFHTVFILFAFCVYLRMRLLSSVAVKRQLAGVPSLPQGLNHYRVWQLLYLPSHLASPGPYRVTECSSKRHSSPCRPVRFPLWSPASQVLKVKACESVCKRIWQMDF